jgi:hypothetical protein
VSESLLKTKKLIVDFIEKDIPLLKRYIEELNEENLTQLPDRIHSIKSRLDQIVAIFKSGKRTDFTEERAIIQQQLSDQIRACRARIQDVQGRTRTQLEELSKGAQLLGSYRIGPKTTSNFLDSKG